jgi:hypothetical protein
MPRNLHYAKNKSPLYDCEQTPLYAWLHATHVTSGNERASLDVAAQCSAVQ